MTDDATKGTKIETCRWSLGLGVALLLASLAGAAAIAPRLAPHSPFREAEPVREPARLPAIPVAADPAAPVRVPDGELQPGLAGEYFQASGRLDDFPSPASLTSALRRIDRQVNFDRADGSFAFAPVREGLFVRWTGLVRVPRDGRYRFFTCSGDGSRLFIDEVAVVDNGGMHEMKEAAGDAVLRAGDHELRLELFNDAGHAGCALLWESEGLAKDVVPEGALFHRRVPDGN
jgi:hypothetical protein